MDEGRPDVDIALVLGSLDDYTIFAAINIGRGILYFVIGVSALVEAIIMSFLSITVAVSMLVKRHAHSMVDKDTDIEYSNQGP